ncbi:class I adenylate-forming enzyme family protein [Sphingopyxis sp. DBS4]|jgi:acyl-CoA synthetase (AMP-forming)/AMP-acid ligase II|uniref:class I adenylate-forming enzyme family protein n=1 Tax=Sphingopyxis sp. DBS4 TaxID=2968500 RepID=UPI00214AE540|nr:AMP-binding protein [Sphingopyxis sp. DBS4]
MENFRPVHLHWAPGPQNGGTLIRDEHRALSSDEFAAEVAGLAFMFVQQGIGRGDVVATMLPNRLDIVVAMFAAWRLGAAFMPINPDLTRNEALYQIEDSGSRLVLVDARAANHIAGTKAALLSVDACLVPSGAVLPDPGVAAHETALLIYTSGTTGRPKGVMLSHGNIDAMTRSIHAALAMRDELSLLVLPLFHVNALLVSILAPLAAGGRAHILKGFDRHSFWQSICRSGATYFSGVPAMYLLLSGEQGEVARAPRLRFAICGAAPMPAGAIAAFEGRYGVPVIEGYGLTESTVGAALNPLEGPRRPGSVGKAMPGIEIAIMGTGNRRCPPGRVGEIWVRGPNVMTGYLQRPEETAEVLTDGWLRTGDLGRLDFEGWLTIAGRKKDLIIRGGENIYPSELEQVIAATDLVAEVAVIGRSDDVMGEVPVAFVAAANGAAADDVRRRLEADVERHLARFKRPVAYHFLDSLPRNAIGKVDKLALKRRLEGSQTADAITIMRPNRGRSS